MQIGESVEGGLPPLREGSTTRCSGRCCSPAARRSSRRWRCRPGKRVLEAGIGTGLSLPLYPARGAHHRHRHVERNAREGAPPRARRVFPTSRRCWRWTPRRLDSRRELRQGGGDVRHLGRRRGRQRVLEELHRVCKPDGEIIIVNHVRSENRFIRRDGEGPRALLRQDRLPRRLRHPRHGVRRSTRSPWCRASISSGACCA